MPAWATHSSRGKKCSHRSRSSPASAPMTALASATAIPARHPSTSKDFAQELHTLLHNAGVPPPYVLVGHSMGGFDVRLYASLYRSEVSRHGSGGFFPPRAAETPSPGDKRSRRDLAARAGVFRIHHALRNPASSGILRQRCCSPRRRLQLPQRARKRSRAEGSFRERRSNRRHRLTRRHASGGALARSRHAPARPPRRPGQARQRRLATDAARVGAPLHQRQASDRQEQRALHPTRPPRPRDRSGPQCCRTRLVRRSLRPNPSVRKTISNQTC